MPIYQNQERISEFHKHSPFVTLYIAKIDLMSTKGIFQATFPLQNVFAHLYVILTTSSSSMPIYQNQEKISEFHKHSPFVTLYIAKIDLMSTKGIFQATFPLQNVFAHLYVILTTSSSSMPIYQNQEKISEFHKHSPFVTLYIAKIDLMSTKRIFSSNLSFTKCFRTSVCNFMLLGSTLCMFRWGEFKM